MGGGKGECREGGERGRAGGGGRERGEGGEGSSTGKLVKGKQVSNDDATFHILLATWNDTAGATVEGVGSARHDDTYVF